ncbi:MAG TPA: recombinase family protein [Syntrophales bacterium]|nr:recombinase family protein [Syntrophales bacterium]
MHSNANIQPINCAIYTRVSVDERAETQAYSTLDNQRDSCIAYIESQKSLGWKVFKVYEDAGQSGGSLNRTALKQLIEDIKRKRIQTVVVYKIDRLTRNHKDFYSLLEVFNEHDVKFVSTTQHFDTTSPAGRLLLHIMLEFAQFEREMSQERTYDKRFAMAKRGMWCGGFVPLGYDVKKKKLVINKEEAKIVQLCFELYPKLASMGKIADKLNEMGYRTKKFYVRGKDAAGSTKFDKKKISNILTNNFYIGKVRFRDKNGKQYIFDGEHKPIITDKKLWDSVQNILVSNRETHKTFKQNKYEMLFLGLVTCGHCGSTMTNSSKEKKGKMYLYYRCTAAVIKSKKACPVRTVAADELEEFLIGKFKELGNNQTLLRKSIEKANHLAKQGLDPLRKEKERAGAQLAKVNQQLKNLIEFVKTADMDKKRSRGIVKEMSDLEGSKEKLEDEVRRIETNMQHLSQHVIDADTFSRLFKEFPKVFETFSFDEKRNLILLLVKEVIYTPSKVRVLFWGDIPEMNFDLKNPPDWTPPPDGGDKPYTPKGPGGSSVESPVRTRYLVRTGVLNGSAAGTRKARAPGFPKGILPNQPERGRFFLP